MNCIDNARAKTRPSPQARQVACVSKTDEVALSNFFTSSTTSWSPFPKGEGWAPLPLGGRRIPPSYRKHKRTYAFKVADECFYRGNVYPRSRSSLSILTNAILRPCRVVGCFFILSAEGACFQARATPNYPPPKVRRSIVNRPFDPSSASLGIVGDFLVISIVLSSDADACDIGELFVN